MSLNCPLCRTEGFLFKAFDKQYMDCPCCRGIAMDPHFFLTPEQEKAHYESHNNDVNDSRYQAFVSSIVEGVQKKQVPENIGLDYGSGTGPVITKLLGEAGYTMKLYDPFFAPYPEHLLDPYDFIVCCEVVEHFHHPHKEFQRLHGLIKPGGRLYIKTELFVDDRTFQDWYYPRDPSHVFFYRLETFQWIREHIGFKALADSREPIVLSR